LPAPIARLALAGTVWVASDIHLGPAVPATAQAFYRFLDDAATRADALVLCGDIFDAWIGDDYALREPPAWLADALGHLRHTASRIPLWLGRGNRDFLMGLGLARALGAQLLPEPVMLNTDAGFILLSHGDEYCTGDPGYQRFRRVVRHPGVQRVFLSLGLPTRRRIADWARRRSQASNRYKPRDIMDVAPEAIKKAFTDSGARIMVHGHTHRPAVHAVQMPAGACTRIVLPDWDFDHDHPGRGGWLAIDRHGPVLHTLKK